MNALIGTLNAWADHALRFAWPMLWQSSLLIGLLFALDLLLKRRLRPAVRYVLWLVVLVKLLLPPSLALPTSAGWWLQPAKAAPARPRPSAVVVTYGANDLLALPSAPPPIFVAPLRPRLSPLGWALVGTVTVSLGLLAWLLGRWRRVALNARHAAPASACLNGLPAEWPRISLRLTDQDQSPAVCGLFRPVILLPRSLAERLPPAQLRAVLLHELVHLRRGDVWVNCAQALLQIAYWWHPLLWLANARIRRVREEAVDDAVMLALKEDAETYAPTLLEVAKLALRRPLASLGLIGILESRSSLRQRIERLIDFRPPHKAGLTLGSALAVLGFAALAVPMGEAPPPTAGASPPPEQEVSVSGLVQEGRLLYELGNYEEAKAKFTQAVQADPRDQAANDHLEFVNGVIERRNNVRMKLSRIRLDKISFDRLPLSQVVGLLAEDTKMSDPEKPGVNFIIFSAESGSASPEATPKPGTGLPSSAASAGPEKLSSLAITISPPLVDIRLVDVLDAIVKVAGRPIRYSVEEYGVVLSASTSSEPPALYLETFKVDPNTLLGGLRTAMGLGATNDSGGVVPLLRDYLAKAGVDLGPPKSVVWNDRQGMLRIRATLEDLNIVERAIQLLGLAPPQLKAAPTGERPTRTAGPGLAAPEIVTNSAASDPSPSPNSLDQDIEKSHETTPFYIRTFKVDPNTLIEGLHLVMGSVETNGWTTRALRDYFTRAGADLDPTSNPGKTIFFNERQGMLMVRGTMQDLEIIEREIAALGVPMEETPDVRAVPPPAASDAATNTSLPPDSTNDVFLQKKIKASTLTQDGKLLYEMGKLDEAQAKLKLAIKSDPHNEAALYYLNLVTAAKFARAAKLHQMPKETRIEPISRESLPVPDPYTRTNLVSTAQGREAIITRLERIRLDSVAYNALPLGEVVRGLTEESRKRDPSGLGVKFVLESGADANVAGEGAVDHLTGQSKPARSGAPSDLSSIPITIQPPLTNVALVDVLDAVMKVAGRPMKYVISDKGIFFSARPEHEPPPLYVRAFKVDPNTVLEILHLAKSQAETIGAEAVTRALRDYFARVGVDLDPTNNPGKSLFWNDRHGMLVVRATMQDLDLIEAAIPLIHLAPPQINLKCKVVAVPQNDTKALGFDWYLGNMLMTNGSTGPEAGSALSSNGVPATAKPPGTFPGNPHASTTNEPGVNAKLLTSGLHRGNNPPFPLCGILTDPQYRVVIKALQQRDGPELLLSTEVTTSSGRQVQCKSTENHRFVEINKQALTPPGITITNGDESPLYVAEPMELGVVLDVIPTVLEDGYTVRMPVVGTVLEFLGYEDARTNRVAAYVNGKRKWVTPPLPHVRTQQMASTVNVWDGQTAVLGGLVSERTTAFKDKVPMLGDVPLLGRLFRREGETTQKRNLLIFVTPTIIDPAGNRVHSEDDLPFTRDAIPRQPPR